MTDSETSNQPLLGAPAQHTAVDVGAPGEPRSPRPSRAYKVAGFTLLACVLIAGQAMIAYFLLSQRSDIQSLTEQNNKFNSQMSQGRSVSVPGQKHMAMNALPAMLDVSMDEGASTAGQGKTADLRTDCEMEAAGMKPVKVPGFRPACDQQGLYNAQQCYMGHCWCVNPNSGVLVPGRTNCAIPIVGGGLLTMTEVDPEALTGN